MIAIFILLFIFIFFMSINVFCSRRFPFNDKTRLQNPQLPGDTQNIYIFTNHIFEVWEVKNTPLEHLFNPTLQ